jgi:hypothetical protein
VVELVLTIDGPARSPPRPRHAVRAGCQRYGRNVTVLLTPTPTAGFLVSSDWTGGGCEPNLQNPCSTVLVADQTRVAARFMLQPRGGRRRRRRRRQPGTCASPFRHLGKGFATAAPGSRCWCDPASTMHRPRPSRWWSPTASPSSATRAQGCRPEPHLHRGRRAG